MRSSNYTRTSYLMALFAERYTRQVAFCVFVSKTPYYTMKIPNTGGGVNPENKNTTLRNSKLFLELQNSVHLSVFYRFTPQCRLSSVFTDFSPTPAIAFHKGSFTSAFCDSRYFFSKKTRVFSHRHRPGNPLQSGLLKRTGP